MCPGRERWNLAGADGITTYSHTHTHTHTSGIISLFFPSILYNPSTPSWAGCRRRRVPPDLGSRDRNRHLNQAPPQPHTTTLSKMSRYTTPKHSSIFPVKSSVTVNKRHKKTNMVFKIHTQIKKRRKSESKKVIKTTLPQRIRKKGENRTVDKQTDREERKFGSKGTQHIPTRLPSVTVNGPPEEKTHIRDRGSRLVLPWDSNNNNSLDVIINNHARIIFFSYPARLDCSSWSGRRGLPTPRARSPGHGKRREDQTDVGLETHPRRSKGRRGGSHAPDVSWLDTEHRAWQTSAITCWGCAVE